MNKVFCNAWRGRQVDVGGTVVYFHPDGFSEDLSTRMYLMGALLCLHSGAVKADMVLAPPIKKVEKSKEVAAPPKVDKTPVKVPEKLIPVPKPKKAPFPKVEKAPVKVPEKLIPVPKPKKASVPKPEKVVVPEEGEIPDPTPKKKKTKKPGIPKKKRST